MTGTGSAANQESLSALRGDRQKAGLIPSHWSMADRTGTAHSMCIARQVVLHLKPAELLGDMHMGGRSRCVGLGQGAVVQVHLVGDAVRLIGDRRAAARTEAAPHTGRRGVDPRCSLGQTEPVAHNTDKGGDRGGDVPAATVAVAMKHPVGRAGELVSDVAAKAAPRGYAHFAHRVAWVPRMTVLCADSTPPLPCTIAVSQSLTWR